jgi:hypothetical protein
LKASWVEKTAFSYQLSAASQAFRKEKAKGWKLKAGS